MRRLASSASGATSGPTMAEDGRFRQAAAYPSIPCSVSSTARCSARPVSRVRTRLRSAPKAARSTASIDGRSAAVAGRTHSAGPPGPVWPGRAADTSPARPPGTAGPDRNVPTNDTLRRTGAKPSFSYSGLARVGGEQRHRRAARLGQQVLHQRAAQAAARVPGRDQHHPDRREIRAPARQDHRPGQSAAASALPRRVRPRRTPQSIRAAAPTWPARATSPGRPRARRTASGRRGPACEWAGTNR